MNKVTWQRLLEGSLSANGETWSDIESVVEFDDGFGGSEGVPFTAWTKNYVYFPAVCDGSEWVGQVPRNPNVEKIGCQSSEARTQLFECEDEGVPMSQLRPNEEDEVFAQGHSDAGFHKALCRIKQLEELLKRALAADDLEGSRSMLGADIAAVLFGAGEEEVSKPRWRVGRRLGRTLYLDDVCVGIVDTFELAAELVTAANRRT